MRANWINFLSVSFLNQFNWKWLRYKTFKASDHILSISVISLFILLLKYNVRLNILQRQLEACVIFGYCLKNNTILIMFSFPLELNNRRRKAIRKHWYVWDFDIMQLIRSNCNRNDVKNVRKNLLRLKHLEKKLKEIMLVCNLNLNMPLKVLQKRKTVKNLKLPPNLKICVF